MCSPYRGYRNALNRRPGADFLAHGNTGADVIVPKRFVHIYILANFREDLT